MAKHKTKIPQIIIRRLPVYYKILKQLKSSSKDYVSSQDLAKLTGFSSSLIRKDLSYFGTFGRKSYGYDICCLFNQIGQIMGFDKQKNLIIIGAGHLGRALAYNRGYQERGYNLKAVFDKNSRLIGEKINNLKVRDINDLEKYLGNTPILVAALTIDNNAAQKITDRLIAAGIKAIWNFTNVSLKTPAEVLVEDQIINQGLCHLSCKLKQNDCLEFH